SIGNLET
ncbi:hypothetical protein J1605_017495, partial [Eschrichtius robustus]